MAPQTRFSTIAINHLILLTTMMIVMILSPSLGRKYQLLMASIITASTDEGALTTYFDDDLDGYGDINAQSCLWRTTGYVSNFNDCDDSGPRLDGC